MKKIFLALLIFLFGINVADSQQVEAYSVTVETDSIYTEVIPDSLINNIGTVFKKYTKKAMKYYNKYKDADDYTYVSKVPDDYRDFMPIAKQIQDSDEIIIKNPFYIYEPIDNMAGESAYKYYFIAEKDGKKLCMFSIYIDSESGKISLWYDKMLDSHFTIDEETVGETLFYKMDEIIYAETRDKTSVMWDKRLAGKVNTMISMDSIDWEAANYQFKNKNYSEKREEIFDYLEKSKKGKLINKAEKNLKAELEDEYIEPEKDAEESDRSRIYIMIGIGILVIGVVISGIIFMIKRKTTA